MKILILTFSLCILCVYQSEAQKETFKFFKAKLRPQQILGINKFNDVGFIYYTTPILNYLTDDTATYIFRLGSVRLDERQFEKGTFNLFNLSYSQGIDYPLLDKIDFEYYKRFGFTKMELDSTALLSNDGYKKFKKSITEAKTDAEAKKVLWQDANFYYRNKLMKTRFFINSQPIQENKKIRKHFSANLSVSFKADVKKLLKGIGDLSAKAQVETYIDNVVSSEFNVTGYYTSVVFQEEYVNEILSSLENTHISEVTNKQDEFSVSLKRYIDMHGVALNTGILLFQFKGLNHSSKLITDSIATSLQGSFNLPALQVASITAMVNIAWAKQVSETFSNDFSKVWIIRFGTHYRLDSLHLMDYSSSSPSTDVGGPQSPQAPSTNH